MIRGIFWLCQCGTMARARAACCWPRVGIFWRVGGVLVVDHSTLAEAEPYGDCLTHPAGPLRALGAMAEAWSVAPGGFGASASDRIHRIRRMAAGADRLRKPTRRFVIYADRRLQAPDVIAAVKTAFGLDRLDAVVRSDLHYR